MSLDASPRGFYASCRNFRRRAFAALCVFAAVFAAPPQEARAQAAGGSPDIRISQIYTRGGEAGATFQSDFVEIYNRAATYLTRT